MYKIDNVDISIVNMLLEDGRKSAAEIARQIGDISERAVRYRIERMVKKEIICVSAIISPQAFGLDTYADVWIEVEADKIFRKLLKQQPGNSDVMSWLKR